MKTAKELVSEAAEKVDFSHIRYAQCWEDTDVLLAALRVRQDGKYLSIGSAGDNALSIVSKGAKQVIAVDLNPAQIALIHLKKEVYRRLTYTEMRDFLDWKVCPSHPQMAKESIPIKKHQIYTNSLRKYLPKDVQAFWDANQDLIQEGINGVGKFERYFTTFREKVLPLVHNQKTVKGLFQEKNLLERNDFYAKTWNSWRWKGLFRVFFSRFVLGRLGRDPRFFDYVKGPVGNVLIERCRYAMTNLNPAENSYYRWVLEGKHTKALPYVLREENFENIKKNIDALEISLGPIESFTTGSKFDGYNLSDIFEYMSEENTEVLLRNIAVSGNAGARLVYWNMMAPRSRPESMENILKEHQEESSILHATDKARFYERLIIEEVLS